MTANPYDNIKAVLGRNSERIKGILIVVVAADHNDWFRQLAPNLFEPLTFHVLGFFLLAFTFGTKEWSLSYISNRIARYMIPYWWALSATTLAFFLCTAVMLAQVRVYWHGGLQCSSETPHLRNQRPDY